MGKRPPWNEFRGLMSKARAAARCARESAHWCVNPTYWVEFGSLVLLTS
jgi:hypothetical protein